MMRKLLLIFLFLAAPLLAQEPTRIPAVRHAGTTLPVACVVGDEFVKTDAAAGQKSYLAISSSPCTWEQQTGAGGGGDNITVNGAAAADADFDSATPAAPANGLNVVWQKDALTPNNVSAHILQNAGTDVTADLEEEAHVTEHAENGADELLGEALGTACTENQILKANATGGLNCAADATGGSPTFDQVGAGTNANALVVGTGGTLGVSGSGTIAATSATTATTATTANAGDSATAFFPSGILEPAIGGTGNGFALFSGPATTEKTFTLPNASTTILTTNAAVTAAQGGTGQSTTATLGRFLKGDGTNWGTSTGAASGTGACGANSWASTLNSDAAPTCTQPDFSNLTGTVGDAQIAAGAVDGGSAGEIADGTVDSNDLATANKTITKTINIFDPTTGDTNLVQIYWPAAVTLQRVTCSIDAGTSVTIQFDERAEITPNTAGVNSLTAALVCDTDSQITTSFSDAVIAADVPHNLQITGAVGTPGVVRIHVKAQVN